MKYSEKFFEDDIVFAYKKISTILKDTGLETKSDKIFHKLLKATYDDNTNNNGEPKKVENVFFHLTMLLDREKVEEIKNVQKILSEKIGRKYYDDTILIRIPKKFKESFIATNKKIRIPLSDLFLGSFIQLVNYLVFLKKNNYLQNKNFIQQLQFWEENWQKILQDFFEKDKY